MKKSGALEVLAAILALAGCDPSVPAADLLLRGGAIHTMDDARSLAEAVAVRAGQIVFVGSDQDAERYIGPRTEVLELEGRMVLPGFHDSHVHPISGGIELGQCNLNGIATAAALYDAIRSCAAELAPGEWLVGGGWDLPLFPGANPHRADLDRLAMGRPAYLGSADGHSSWVSTRALEIAGIDRSTPDPPNGRIERDPETGQATGTLRESASELVSRHLPAVSEEDRIEGLKRALRIANAYGITSLIEASGGDRAIETYAALARREELTVRLRISLATDESRDESQVESLVERRAVCEAAGLRCDAAKIFADGVIEARTAALLEDYRGLDGRGELSFPPEVLDPLVARLDAERFQIHVHAIGDRAIRATLDALEKAQKANGPRDSRHHLAHIELFHPEDIPRFRELGVAANFQPLWAYADSYITELTEPALGPERSRWLYPIKSLADSGAVLAAGSDWSVSSMNPLEAMQVAVTRRSLEDIEGEGWIPEQRVDLDTILAAYTRGGAFLQHQEQLTGSLEIGKRADLVVLDRNLFEIPLEEIHRVEVVLTLLDGKPVFRKPEALAGRRQSAPRRPGAPAG